MYCKICKKDYHNLSNHLILKHKISPKDYFDEFFKTEENSHCRLCHVELKDFIKLSCGYGIYCKECSFKDKFKHTWKLKTKNELVEIKGPQLLKLMQESNSLDNAKYRCMIDHNVKIITDCSEYLNYIDEKYGKEYLKQFRNGK